MKTFILTLLFLLMPLGVLSQSPNSIKQRCPNPYGSIYGTVFVSAIGNIQYNPCPTKKSIFTGIVDFSGATITGAVTGTGTTDFITRWTNGATGVIGNTPFSWNGTTYNFNNTALNSTFPLNLTPTSASGIFNVGNAASAYISLTQSTQLAGVTGKNGIAIDSSNATTQIGDINIEGNGTILSVQDTSNSFIFGNDNSAGVFNLTQILTYNTNRTISGVSGAVTIDKPVGTVNIGAGQTTAVVTNNTVTANSLIFCTVQTQDAGTVYCAITNKTSGAFTVRVPASVGTTSVAFLVTN